MENMVAPGWVEARIIPLLFVVQFLTWIGMFAMWVFSFAMVASLSAPHSGSIAEATGMVGRLFALYVGLAAMISLRLPRLFALVGKARGHGLALLAGAAGLGSCALVTAPWQLFGSYALIAIGWASISSTPYTLAADRVTDGNYAGAMGIFNFSTVVPQVVLALCMAPLTQKLAPAVAISAGGASMAAAGIIMLLLSTAYRG